MSYREVILSQVNAVRVHGTCDIRMVIHNEQCPCPSRQRDKLQRDLIDFTPRAAFIAVLKKLHSGFKDL